MKLHTIIGLCALSAFLVACEKTPSATETTEATSDQPAWLLASMPEGAISLAAFKQEAKEGQQVILRGRIGGRKVPISEGSATFILIDTELVYCGQTNDEETCATPWDYCCETTETITANSATIMLVDESGNPMTIDLQAAGLKELDEIVAVGTIGPRPAPEVLIVMATKLHRIEG